MLRGGDKRRVGVSALAFVVFRDLLASHAKGPVPFATRNSHAK